jgi:hypothetical protein
MARASQAAAAARATARQSAQAIACVRGDQGEREWLFFRSRC